MECIVSIACHKPCKAQYLNQQPVIQQSAIFVPFLNIMLPSLQKKLVIQNQYKKLNRWCHQ